MLRKFSLCLITSGSVMFGLAGLARAESFTTRIEPRPFYGAVITLEEGVRVIRPLPPERQVIINPDGTPLTLGFSDTHVYEQSSQSNYNYNADGSEAGGGGSPVYSAPYFANGRGFGRGRFGMGNHFGNHGGFHRGRGFQVH
jgi:hypothetical protein